VDHALARILELEAELATTQKIMRDVVEERDLESLLRQTQHRTKVEFLAVVERHLQVLTARFCQVGQGATSYELISLVTKLVVKLREEIAKP
jgi:hypothetical protein